MIINLVYDPSANNAPASFKAALQQAAAILDAAITDPITVTIEVGYGEYPQDQSPVTNGASKGGPNTGALVPYSEVVSALTADASPGNTNFTWLAAQPQDPSTLVVVSPAQLKAGHASGLIPAADNGIDGFAGFASALAGCRTPSAAPGSADLGASGSHKQPIMTSTSRRSQCPPHRR
jgi:serralysin